MAHVEKENSKVITKLLIANRGEIARRIMRTAQDMGISTVAIYSESDAKAPFVSEADIAIPLKGRTSAETYLDIEQVLNACKSSGADAVHPGYGFLSENTSFARAVTEAGITWVGPSPDAIEQMGDKLSAKALMVEAGVPTLQATELKAGEDAKKPRRKLVTLFLLKLLLAAVAVACASSNPKPRLKKQLPLPNAKPPHPLETTPCSSSAG